MSTLKSQAPISARYLGTTGSLFLDDFLLFIYLKNCLMQEHWFIKCTKSILILYCATKHKVFMEPEKFLI